MGEGRTQGGERSNRGLPHSAGRDGSRARHGSQETYGWHGRLATSSMGRERRAGVGK